MDKETGFKNPDDKYYAAHLAVINATNSVLTTQDVCNEKGMIVVAKGTPVTHEVAEKIARFRLLTPLDNSISLAKTISAEDLISTVNKLIDSYRQYGASDIEGDEREQLQRCCAYYGDFPPLQQKLTILSERLPDIFKECLIVSVISMKIAYQLGWDDASVKAVFLGGLMHDVGMLNLDPDIVNKSPDQLTAQEQKNLEAHSAIARYFLNLIPGIPKVSVRAVFEHHERINGTGYPHNKTGKKLCTEGQIIGLADVVHAYFHRKLLPRGYKVKDCIPILQMTRHMFPKEVLDALLCVLYKNNQPTGRAFEKEALPLLIQGLRSGQTYFQQWLKNSKEFAENYLINKGLDNNGQIGFMLQQLDITVRSSGLLSGELNKWLHRASESGDLKEHQEIEYTALLFEELRYQFQQLNKMIIIIITTKADDNLFEVWQKLAKTLDTLPTVKWR